METKSLIKLLEFQKKINAIKKDGKNPHFKSSYATLPQILSEVKPILSELGLVLLQPIKGSQVHTTILDSESGEIYDSSMEMPSGLSPQQAGSAITYYRRYLLAGMLSLEIEDDDGNMASAGGKTKEEPVAANEKPWLNKYTDKSGTTLTETFNKVVEGIKSGFTIEQVESRYKLSKDIKAELEQLKHTLAA